MSSDVFVYIGELLPKFYCIKKHSSKDSVFLFSTEHTENEDFVLRDTARYAHSKDYIISVATESGFQLAYFREANIRYERDRWIKGGIYALKCI